MKEVMPHIAQRRIDSWAMWTIIGWVAVNVSRLIEWTTIVHFVNDDWRPDDKLHKLTRKDIVELLRAASLAKQRDKLPKKDWKNWHITNSILIRLKQWLKNNFQEKRTRIWKFFVEWCRNKSIFDENWDPTQEAIDTLCKILWIK